MVSASAGVKGTVQGMEVQGLFGRKLHMTVIYPDGTVFLGKRDLRHVIDHLGLNRIDFSGRSVCDIATDEGFFAFWAEGAGAERILATDVDDFARYDWGFQKTKTLFAKTMRLELKMVNAYSTFIMTALAARSNTYLIPFMI